MDSVGTAMRDVINSISSQSYLTIPTLPQLISVTKKFTSSEAVTEVEIVENDDNIDDEEAKEDSNDDISDGDQTLNFLRTNCDRLTDRRATDFSQVMKRLQHHTVVVSGNATMFH